MLPDLKSKDLSQENKQEIWDMLQGPGKKLPEDFDTWWDGLEIWEREALLYK